MKKNSFDLTGKAINCSGINKITFNTLKKFCNGVNEGDWSKREKFPFYTSLSLDDDAGDKVYVLIPYDQKHLKPIDILGEPLMNAIEQGFTPVFEGEIIPVHSSIIHETGEVRNNLPWSIHVMKNSNIIAYKSVGTQESTDGFSELKHVDNTLDWKERELETYGDDDKIESLAREIFVSQISRHDIDFIAEKSWQAAREFYKVKG